MTPEVEQLRAQLAASEARYTTLCHDVARQAGRIVGKCLNAQGAQAEAKADEAGKLAAALVTFAHTALQQQEMGQEVGSDAYDLAALQVDATSASNSETGWEREE